MQLKGQPLPVITLPWEARARYRDRGKRCLAGRGSSSKFSIKLRLVVNLAPSDLKAIPSIYSSFLPLTISSMVCSPSPITTISIHGASLSVSTGAKVT